MKVENFFGKGKAIGFRFFTARYDNPLLKKRQLQDQWEEHWDGDKEGRTHKAPVRFGFVLKDGSEGSLCCKNAHKDDNKWMVLWRTKTGVKAEGSNCGNGQVLLGLERHWHTGQ